MRHALRSAGSQRRWPQALTIVMLAVLAWLLAWLVIWSS